jgi:hypothetical protein
LKDSKFVSNKINATSCWPGVLVSTSVLTPENSSSILSVTAIVSDTIHTLVLISQLNVPENSRDDNFQRVVYRARIDFSKLLEEKSALSFYGKPFMTTLLKSLSFDLKFPLKKVRSFIIKR